MNDIELMTKFVQEKPLLYDKAVSIGCGPAILSNIYKNQTIFNRLITIGCLIFIEPVITMVFAKKVSFEPIIIHFIDLGLYTIFNNSQYFRFISNITDDINFENIVVNVTQLVPINTNQKLVIQCDDIENIKPKILKHIRECFNNPYVRILKNQITIDVHSNNEIELSNNYDKLYSFIIGKGDNSCLSLISEIVTLSNPVTKYRKYLCNDFTEIKEENELDMIVKNIIPKKNDVIPMNNNQKQQNSIEEKQTTCRKWILNNKIFEKETPGNYFNRYHNDNKQGLNVTQFGIIRNEYYISRRLGDNSRYLSQK
jgi:hypothetical protein